MAIDKAPELPGPIHKGTGKATIHLSCGCCQNLDDINLKGTFSLSLTPFSEQTEWETYIENCHADALMDDWWLTHLKERARGQ